MADTSEKEKSTQWTKYTVNIILIDVAGKKLEECIRYSRVVLLIFFQMPKMKKRIWSMNL